MMTMVMLSQPTPPVSELEARQLSIMFSQIFSRSCFAAMPRRTNSVTAWEDWQSQIPGERAEQSANMTGACHVIRPRLTVTRNHQELIIIRNLVYDDVRVGGYDLLLGGEVCALLELEVADGSRQSEVTVDTAEVDESAGSSNSCLLACREQNLSAVCHVFDDARRLWPRSMRTFVLWLVIERQRLCPALDTQHTSGVTRVGLEEI